MITLIARIFTDRTVGFVLSMIQDDTFHRSSIINKKKLKALPLITEITRIADIDDDDKEFIVFNY